MPLGGQPLTGDQESAVIRALSQLWQSVPVGRVDPLPDEVATGAQVTLVRRVSEMAAAGHDPGDDTVVRKARSAGLDWMSWAVDASRLPVTGPDDDVAGLLRVFGQGDANLANFLWDGELVRIVDFEDSGISDRAFELAVLVEHLSAWSDAGLAGERFTAAFDLTQGGAVTARRLAPAGRAATGCCACGRAGTLSRGTRPARARRQAERLLALL